MQIPETTHKRVTYRDGGIGYLLTTKRESELIPVMTLRIKFDGILYHNLEGKYMGLTGEHEYDIITIES